MSRRGDEAGLHVLEAVIIVTLLIANLAFLVSYTAPTSGAESERVDLVLSARDTLVLLDRAKATDDRFGDQASRQFVTEALYGHESNLNGRLKALLPAGARFSIYLDNGYDTRDLVKGLGPARERVTAEKGFSPGWGTTFLATDFDLYHPTTGTVHFTALPVFLGRPHSTDNVTVNLPDGANFTLDPLGNSFFGQAVSPPPSPHDPQVNVTAAHREVLLYGRTTWSHPTDAAALALLGATETQARVGLEGSSLDVGAAHATPGLSVPVSWDFTFLKDSLGAWMAPNSMRVNVSMFAPVPPPRAATEDRLPIVWTGASDGPAGDADMVIPTDGLYGTYLVEARVTFDLVDGGTVIRQAAYLHDRLEIAYREGTAAPLNPAYRLVLEVWFDDWR